MPAASRRLAAIMFTDLVGFTRLGQRDEEAALRLRKEHQALVRPLFAAHGGREVKSLGDGFLIEFSSALESVRCAIAIQEALTQRNAAAGPDDRIWLRIGVHVGDVVGEGDDIVGDAVNVASRIEPLADPGGVCLSAAVYEQVRNKLKVPLESLGARELKHVEQPVEVYRVVLGGVRPASAPPPADSKNVRLAVLPLANLSPDSGDEYFADGLTDELISQVSRIPALRVIARTSVLRYKGSSKTIREVGQDLGVRLALEGSVRKAGGRVRITLRLVDARSEEDLWSSRYDRSLEDIFALQDDVGHQVAEAISGHLTTLGITTLVPIVRSVSDTANVGAYTTYLHARKLWLEKTSEATLQEALRLFEEAARADPDFARAHVGVASCLLWLGHEGVLPLAEADRRCREELTTALRLNPNLDEAHSALAGLLLAEDDVAGSRREAQRAMQLNPSLTDPYRWLAQLEAGAGRIDEAVRLLEEARRIDPVDVNVIAFLGRAYAYAGRDADALAHWARTESIVPFRTHAHRTEYYLGRRDFEAARASLREMERIRPTSIYVDTYGGILAAWTGDVDAARRALQRLRERAERGEFTAFFEGDIQLALGDMDGFVDGLERSLAVHSLPLLEVQYSPLLAGVRSDPRVIDIVRRHRVIQGRATDPPAGAP